MVFRIIYRIIFGYVNNERVISRLSESYPIRRLAQLVYYYFSVGKHAIQQNADIKHRVIDDFRHNSSRIKGFSQRLVQEFRQQMIEAKKELKSKQNK